MIKPQHASDYDAARTVLAERVLLEVWGKLGEFHDYDLVYVLRFYKDGPAAVAAEVTGDERAAESFTHALESLRSRFETPEHNGPMACAEFTGREPGAATQAFAAVQEFLASL